MAWEENLARLLVRQDLNCPVHEEGLAFVINPQNVEASPVRPRAAGFMLDQLCFVGRKAPCNFLEVLFSSMSRVSSIILTKYHICSSHDQVFSAQGQMSRSS